MSALVTRREAVLLKVRSGGNIFEELSCRMLVHAILAGLFTIHTATYSGAKFRRQARRRTSMRTTRLPGCTGEETMEDWENCTATASE